MSEQKYRALEVGEIIEKGDEFVMNGIWRSVEITIGGECDFKGGFRRPISTEEPPKAKKARVEYDIAEGSWLKFSDEVKAFLYEGWSPQGGVSRQIEEDGSCSYAQAFTRAVEE